MKWRIIGAIVSKDLSLYFRNRFIAVITVLGIVAFLVIYFVMPGATSVTEVGLYAPVVPSAFAEEESKNIDFVMVDSETALREAVAGGEYYVGIALPADIMENSTGGRSPTLKSIFPQKQRTRYRSCTAFSSRSWLSSRPGNLPVSTRRKWCWVRTC